MAEDAEAAAVITADRERMMAGVLPGDEGEAAEIVRDLSVTLERCVSGAQGGWVLGAEGRAQWWGLRGRACLGTAAAPALPAPALLRPLVAQLLLHAVLNRPCAAAALPVGGCRLSRAIEVKDPDRTSIRAFNALEQVASLELLQVGAG